MSDETSSPTATGSAAAGWYPDPVGRFDLRFFNGTGWTADVATAGARFVDPLGVGPRPDEGASTGTGAATASMVLGIIAVSTAWMPFLVVVGVITGVLAIAFGVAARRRRASGSGRGRAIAGVAMGASALVAAVLGVLLTIIVLDVYDTYVDPAAHEITVDRCEVAGSRATMTGAITNLDDDAADFSILVGFSRPGTDDVRATTRVAVDDVPAGGTQTFEAQDQVGLDDVDCSIIDVNGPLPFGLSLD